MTYCQTSGSASNLEHRSRHAGIATRVETAFSPWPCSAAPGLRLRAVQVEVDLRDLHHPPPDMGTAEDWEPLASLAAKELTEDWDGQYLTAISFNLLQIGIPNT